MCERADIGSTGSELVGLVQSAQDAAVHSAAYFFFFFEPGRGE